MAQTWLQGEGKSGFGENLRTSCRSVGKHWKVPFACDIVLMKMTGLLKGKKKPRKLESCLLGTMGLRLVESAAAQLTPCLTRDQVSVPAVRGFAVRESLPSSQLTSETSKFISLYSGNITRNV